MPWDLDPLYLPKELKHQERHFPDASSSRSYSMFLARVLTTLLHQHSKYHTASVGALDYTSSGLF